MPLWPKNVTNTYDKYYESIKLVFKNSKNKCSVSLFLQDFVSETSSSEPVIQMLAGCIFEVCFAEIYCSPEGILSLSIAQVCKQVQQVLAVQHIHQGLHHSSHLVQRLYKQEIWSSDSNTGHPDQRQ